jgi:hypothetical protein
LAGREGGGGRGKGVEVDGLAEVIIDIKGRIFLGLSGFLVMGVLGLVWVLGSLGWVG